MILSYPMTLSQFIQTYSGKKVGDGECGTLVRQYWNEVVGVVPPSYPDAKDYWYNPAPPYSHTTTPNIGDIAVYDAHGAFPEGHIAIYIGNGQVFEQNADPDGSPAHTFTRANTFLLGYLTQEGDDMYNGKSAQEWAAIAQDALNFKGPVTASKGWLDPTVFSDDINRIHPAIDNLIDDRNATAAALGIPSESDASTLTATINALKKGGVNSVVVNGVDYVPES